MPSEIERLYREHRAGLVRLVERELHDRQDAEDVVQTAFLDAQRALERGTIPRNPRAWLAAIALNSAHRLRRRHLRAEPLEEYAVQEASAMPEIRDALSSLPTEQRVAVLYRDVLGLSYGETAEQMGTSVNAVTMLLHRGRQRLRQGLGVTVGGLGAWRWLKHAGMPQAAVAKGAAAVVVAAGLTTTGIVAARAVARSGTGMTAAALTTGSANPTARAGRTPGGPLVSGSGRRDFKTARGSAVSVAPAATQGPGPAATQASTPAPVGSTTAGTARSLLPSTLPLPTVSVPKLPIPTTPVTVTVRTPITSVTVTTPTATTVAVTTPVVTVTVPIP